MSDTWRLVETDNFGGDYPAEKWACPYTFTSLKVVKKAQEALNLHVCPEPHSDRYIKVVELPYDLQPGFEP